MINALTPVRFCRNCGDPALSWTWAEFEKQTSFDQDQLDLIRHGLQRDGFAAIGTSGFIEFADEQERPLVETSSDRLWTSL